MFVCLILSEKCGLKKDELQWMTLALVGDRKASGFKICSLITPRGMHFTSTPLPSLVTLGRVFSQNCSRKIVTQVSLSEYLRLLMSDVQRRFVVIFVLCFT